MKIVKQFSLSLVMVLILIQPVSAETNISQKDEVVYGFLAHDGQVESIQVVNLYQDQSILDYGDYLSLENLSTQEKIVYEDDKIEAEISQKNPSILGTLKHTDLPWLINIQHSLNGQDIEADALLGQSGQWEMKIEITANPKVDEHFVLAHALQVSVSIPLSVAKRIDAENTTLALAGSNTQINMVVMPGKTLSQSISAEVKDFELNPITISGIRMAFNLDLDTSELTQQFSELSNAISKLDTGSSDLYNGLKSLYDGYNTYNTSFSTYTSGMSALATGVNDLNTGLSALNTGLSTLDASGNTLNTTLAQIKVITDPLGNADLSQLVAGLQAGLTQYTAGVSQSSTGLSTIATNVSSLNTSVGTLASASATLFSASNQFNDAILKLRDGLAEYSKGVSTLNAETKNLDQEVIDGITEMMDKMSAKNEPVLSFVSSKNTDIQHLQFVIQTAPLQITDDIEDIEVVEDEVSFVDRLWALFSPLFKGN